MNGEHILVVDDDPMSVKLIRALLTGEGYSVHSAKSAEEALTVLKTFEPRLILIDIQLPGVDGWELVRQLRSNPSIRQPCIVALTAFALRGDEHKARSAGCDGYIAKTIDVRTLPATVAEFLKKRSLLDGHPSIETLKTTADGAQPDANGPSITVESAAPLPAHEEPEMVADLSPAPASGDSEDLLSELRNNLLAQGMDEIPKLLTSLETEFNIDRARRFFHRWAGIAGTLGFPEITEQARKLEGLVTYPATETRGALRAALQELKACFSNAALTKKPDRGWPPEIVGYLCDKRLALIGFSQPEGQRITAALQQTQTSAVTFTRAMPGSRILSPFDMLVVKVPLAARSNPWANPEQLENNIKPLLLIGPCEALLEASAIREHPPDFLTPPWDADEVILRAYRLLSRSRARRGTAIRAPGASMPVVVIADDDDATTRLVSASLQKFRVDCRVACDGTQALQMVKDLRPSALVLDINMPGLDGFDVLLRMRTDMQIRNIPVILLTARRHEDDIMRGLGYGAADYVVKPFNPIELAARVSRLID
jgi:CheY-like chemotaxis protein